MVLKNSMLKWLFSITGGVVEAFLGDVCRISGANTLQAGAISPFSAIGTSHFAIRRKFCAAAARKTVFLASQLLFCFFWESMPLSLALTEIGLESSTQNAPDHKHCLATKKRKKIQIEPLPEFG